MKSSKLWVIPCNGSSRAYIQQFRPLHYPMPYFNLYLQYIAGSGAPLLIIKHTVWDFRYWHEAIAPC
eukprot:4787442-Pleurochrysis_carterae.AAC.1